MTDISQKQGGWTPWEWEISEARTVDDEFMVCGGEGQGFGLIATVTRKDDARLIAAAPDLYEALEAVLNTSGARSSGYSAIKYSKAVALAENALIKARANPSTDQDPDQ